ncbi:hypothetical protein AVCANL279_07275 [Campylobacter canadensis]|uniref:hypothetical protein n=1 Tax=Campylobacter canadensis TaxID=449520 RepID=UPI001554A5DD|nr:hypothetical protein [Campylobacter canadensis]MBZ7995184.1 hypothetical protein [Campylobacter canadensis]MBZ7997119.1 hypothetical protein [Campylobacter canadensis]MBZ8000548.1 hypothetical protein [Campylobacter canadensis]MBZ8003859.1 hypothetical protein [Campylobacter canadensis]
MLVNEKIKEANRLFQKLKQAGFESPFFRYINKVENHLIIRPLYKKIAELIGIELLSNNDTELSYYKLAKEEQKKVFEELLKYFKSTYIDFKKEKIKLISKKDLKKLLSYSRKITDLYEKKDYEVKLLKTGSTVEEFKNKELVNILFYDYTTIYFKESSKQELKFFCEEEYITKEKRKNESTYKFILRAVEEINQEIPFFIFVWDGEE